LSTLVHDKKIAVARLFCVTEKSKVWSSAFSPPRERTKIEKHRKNRLDPRRTLKIRHFRKNAMRAGASAIRTQAHTIRSDPLKIRSQCAQHPLAMRTEAIKRAHQPNQDSGARVWRGVE
jgi:hypothetical protein